MRRKRKTPPHHRKREEMHPPQLSRSRNSQHLRTPLRWTSTDKDPLFVIPLLSCASQKWFTKVVHKSCPQKWCTMVIHDGRSFTRIYVSYVYHMYFICISYVFHLYHESLFVYLLHLWQTTILQSH